MSQSPYSTWYKAGFDEPQGLFYEMIIEKTYQRILKPGDTAIDGGASMGWHTIPMAVCVGPTGKIIAVEAIPELSNRLNTIVPKQVRVVAKALGAYEGKIEFNWVKGEPGISGIHKRPMSDNLTRTIEIINVPLTTIDMLVAQIPSSRKVRFIKLDLEGGEYHALLGATCTMKRDRPLIIFEFSRGWLANIYDYTKGGWFRLFSSTGYRLFDLFGRPFTELNWNSRENDDWPWYFIAIGDEIDENYLAYDHADIIQETYKRFRLKSRAYNHLLKGI